MTYKGGIATLNGALLKVNLPPTPAGEGRCKCGAPQPKVEFDPGDAELPAEVVRRRWPRGDFRCGRCGAMTIVYASFEHYIAGDW